MYKILIKGFTEDKYFADDDGNTRTFPTKEDAEAHVDLISFIGWASVQDCEIEEMK